MSENCRVNDCQKRLLVAERDALVEALEQCRTSYCGYAITKSEQYPDVLASFWKEIKRIDGIARAALETIKVPS